MDRVNRTMMEGFRAVRQLREGGGAAAQGPSLHAEMCRVVERAHATALEAGFSNQDAGELVFALVALIDEAAMGADPALRDHWIMQPLALKYYQDAMAGESFYTRLEAILGDASRLDVLRGYYMALLLGFRGRYQVRGGEAERIQVMDRVADALRRGGHLKHGPLSPNGHRPDGASAGTRRTTPLLWAAGICVAAVLAIYTALRIDVAVRASSVSDRFDDVAVGP